MRRIVTNRMYLRCRSSALGECLSLAGPAMSTILLLTIMTPCLGAQTRLPAGLLNSLSVLQEQQAGGGAQIPSPRPKAIRMPEPQAAGQAPAQSPAQSTAQAPAQSAASRDKDQSDDGSQGKQTKRIFGIVPNFYAVSADTQLPPQSAKRKFWIATQNTFDYSAFIFVGIQAGVEQATNTYPEFHQGAAGFGRYYWHTFADQAVGNYVVGAIFPAITHEDSRYYTLFHGGFWHRAGYAFSRVFITRKDDGGKTFNISEVVGNGAVSAISPLYYPSQERNWNEYGERWATTLLTDGVFNIFQEFWPDINRKIFHRH